MRLPWSKPRPEPTAAPPIADRLENEIQQLASIRDDALRVQPGSPLHSWINGAIFALQWAIDPYNCTPPSAVAALRRAGIETGSAP